MECLSAFSALKGLLYLRRLNVDCDVTEGADSEMTCQERTWLVNQGSLKHEALKGVPLTLVRLGGRCVVELLQ